MTGDLKCINPKCREAALRRIDIESTYVLNRYVCPTCARVYNVPTKVGKAAPLVPIVSVGLFAACLLAGQWDDATDVLADILNDGS